jgi:hypothetical protein
MKTPRPDAPATWLGIGIGLVAVALPLRPVHAPITLVWSIFGLAGVSFLAASVLAVRPLIAGSGKRERARRRALLAAECRRLYDALAVLVEDLDHGQARDMVRNYRANFARWALRVFDKAFAAGAIDNCSRALIEAPAANQLEIVRDLFRDAAQALERDQ